MMLQLTRITFSRNDGARFCSTTRQELLTVGRAPCTARCLALRSASLFSSASSLRRAFSTSPAIWYSPQFEQPTTTPSSVAGVRFSAWAAQIGHCMTGLARDQLYLRKVSAQTRDRRQDIAVALSISTRPAPI